MTDALPTAPANWAARLSPRSLTIATAATSLLLMLVFVILIGFVTALVEQGSVRPLGLVVGGVMLLLAGGLGWLLRTLLPAWRGKESPYTRRYTIMWLAVLGLGGIAGMAFGLADGFRSDVPDLFSNKPMPAAFAVTAAIVFLVTLGLATILYFRAIDDHEQSAYLWSSTIAFHVLLFALPVYWLLARGGIVAPIDAGAIIGLVLLSILVQLVSWAWYKYR